MLSQEECTARRKIANAKYRALNLEKLRIKDAEYKAKNAEKMKEQSIKYTQEHRDENAARRRLHHQKNKHNPKYREALAKTAAIWRRNNPEQVALQSADRKFKLERATPSWVNVDLIKTIYQKRDELSILLKVTLEVDHIIPISSEIVCGLHVPENLQLLEKSINSSKNNRFQTDW